MYFLKDNHLTLLQIVGGFAGGFLYVAETTAMLSYPDQNDRGLFLGIWSAMRNSGSIVGGAINFSSNYADSSSGGIAWSTYLIFVGFGKLRLRASSLVNILLIDGQCRMYGYNLGFHAVTDPKGQTKQWLQGCHIS